ncbi:MAG: hypothetical protein NTZ39_03270 [Methanoregula sp.]|nr:hypothetical protein [Methanoregula sp.]
MRPPRIHPMLATIVSASLSAVDGVLFTGCAACPKCGGSLRGYDTKKKRFAVVIERDMQRSLYVYVKRFYCYSCHQLCYAHEPFYPGTRIGSPVVDMGITISATIPPNRVATYLAALGIVIDRTTCRLYAKRTFPAIPTTDVFGIRIPMSVFNLFNLVTQAGEGSRIEGAEVLAACGFPSTYRAPLHPLFPGKEGNERDEQEQKEELQVREPHNDGKEE